MRYMVTWGNTLLTKLWEDERKNEREREKADITKAFEQNPNSHTHTHTHTAQTCTHAGTHACNHIHNITYDLGDTSLIVLIGGPRDKPTVTIPGSYSPDF